MRLELLAEGIAVMVAGQARAALRRAARGPSRAGWSWRVELVGVDVSLEVEPAMFHDWQVEAALLPEGARSVETAAYWLAAR